MNAQQIAPQIEISKMAIGGYEVHIPPGLSELLNDIGGWGTKPKAPAHVNNYTRRVEKRDGRIYTVLTSSKELKK